MRVLHIAYMFIPFPCFLTFSNLFPTLFKHFVTFLHDSSAFVTTVWERYHDRWKWLLPASRSFLDPPGLWTKTKTNIVEDQNWCKIHFLIFWSGCRPVDIWNRIYGQRFHAESKFGVEHAQRLHLDLKIVWKTALKTYVSTSFPCLFFIFESVRRILLDLHSLLTALCSLI